VNVEERIWKEILIDDERKARTTAHEKLLRRAKIPKEIKSSSTNGEETKCEKLVQEIKPKKMVREVSTKGMGPHSTFSTVKNSKFPDLGKHRNNSTNISNEVKTGRGKTRQSTKLEGQQQSTQ